MSDRAAERRLAAIMVADVVGYSRLMESDETGTLVALKGLRTTIFEPTARAHGGRVVKLMGDGVLVEFASAVNAVAGALELQRKMAAANESLPDNRRILWRIGLNLGDVIGEGSDIYGDGVNIAARLEGLAEPGGICISGKIYDEVEGKLHCLFEDRGRQQVKNIARPVRVFAVRSDANEEPSPRVSRHGMTQTISYCRAPDGVRLAWAKLGDGPTLVKAANWLNHLEYDWESPIWHHVLEGLARDHTLIRYDARGNGLSDWDVDEVSLDAFVQDLETVVDAAGVDRFPLLGVSQGCALCIVYAVRHPERVSHLVLYGGFARGGRKRAPEERLKRDAMATLMRVGWGVDDPSFRQMFTSQFLPEGTKAQFDAFNELQRRTTSPECAARYFEVVGDFDIRDLLPQVETPTLVLHVRGDRMAPFEEGRQLAAGIPNSRFVALQGRNHLFLEDEPAAERFFEELRLFLRNA